MASVRAKFKVVAVETYETPAGSARVKLCPVHSSLINGTWVVNEENKSFWQATPSGELTMQINNPEAAKKFKPGQEYYLDFTLAWSPLPGELTEA